MRTTNILDKISDGRLYDIEDVVDEVSGLFAGGNIADEDLDVMMKALQDAYWIAKEKNKKFTPKKYRKD